VVMVVAVVRVVGVVASVAYVAVIVPKHWVVEGAVVLGVQVWEWGGHYAACLSFLFALAAYLDPNPLCGWTLHWRKAQSPNYMENSERKGTYSYPKSVEGSIWSQNGKEES
jgi:hypothetical protein